MDLLLALMLLAAPQEGLKITLGERVTEGQAIVAFSPDGKSYLMARKAQTPMTFGYFLGEPGKVELRKLHETPITWDDVLMGQLTRDSFSRDGSRLALPGSVPREGTRGKDARVVLSDRKGEIEILQPEKAEAWFPAWSPAEDALFFVETENYRAATPGYSVRRYRPAARSAETLYENPDELPLLLRPSPDGTKLAFLSAALAGTRKVGEVRLRILAVADKSVVDSEPFFLDDYIADGSPPIHWSHDGKSVYYYRSPDADKPRGPERYQPAVFDLEKRRTERLTDDHTAFITAVLDADHLLMIAGTEKRNEFRTALLRLSDRKRFLFATNALGVGGLGRTIALFDPEARATYLARLELPE